MSTDVNWIGVTDYIPLSSPLSVFEAVLEAVQRNYSACRATAASPPRIHAVKTDQRLCLATRVLLRRPCTHMCFTNLAEH